MPDYSKLAKGLSSLAKGEGKAARTFKTTDGYTFREMPDGRVTDGDMTWPNAKEFFQDMPHAYQEGDQLGARRAGMESFGKPTGEAFMKDWSQYRSEPTPDELFQQALNKQNAPKPKLTVVKRKGGGVKMQAGGALKAMQAISKAAKSAGQEAPVLANKNLTTLQDFHTSLGDEVRRRALEAQKQMDSWNYKYEPGQYVFTEHGAKNNLPPLKILERSRTGNAIMREDMNDPLSKKIIDPETGRAKRTPYEPGYRVRREIGPDDWSEFVIPETAIKGDVGMAHGGGVHMQVGGALNLIKTLGKAGTKLTPAEEAALRARGMGIPGKDFADPLAAPGMRMSEALGAAGAEGKWLNFTEADRSRVFGPNRGGVGFSALQHYSEPHKQAGTVWGFGNKSVAEKKIRQNDPENTIWTTYAGSPEQHKSNTVVVKDAVATLQAANKAGKVSPQQIDLINERIRQAKNQNGNLIFPEGFDITDPDAMSHAHTFDRRTAISDALMGVGVKKPMISKEFKQANPGVQWQDASDISNILARETDPALIGANTFDVGPHLFTMDNNIIHRPDLNEAFPVQVTGTDLGLRFQPAPFRSAAPEFSKHFPEGQAINAWKMSRGTPRQFVSEEYLTGLQKEGHKDGGSVMPSFTQRLQSALETHMAAGGEVSDNTTPDMTDGGQINYGGQYAHGGKVNMPVRSLRQTRHMGGGGKVGAIASLIEGATNVAPKVDRLSMSYKDVTKRVPEVAEAIEKLNRGEITKAQYNDIVNLY